MTWVKTWTRRSSRALLGVNVARILFEAVRAAHVGRVTLAKAAYSRLKLKHALLLPVVVIVFLHNGENNGGVSDKRQKHLCAAAHAQQTLGIREGK